MQPGLQPVLCVGGTGGLNFEEQWRIACVKFVDTIAVNDITLLCSPASTCLVTTA